MKDVYEGLAGGAGRFAQSWFLPSLLTVGLAAFFLFPAVHNQGVFADIAALGAGERIALIGIIALVLAFVLASTATPLYRVLEGYQLPKRLKEWKTGRHLARRTELRQQVANLVDDPLRRGLVRESLDRYPRSSSSVLPTKLGNALRSGESYGRHQYGLDTVLLWNHLTAVASDEIKDGLARARTMMDFYAGVFWLCPLFGFAAAFAAWYGSSAAHYLGLSAIGLCPLAYAGAVRAAASYAGGLRALVDTSRLSLASQLGLRLPATLNEERDLWESVSEFFAWGPNWGNASQWVATIDASRSNPAELDSERGGA